MKNALALLAAGLAAVLTVAAAPAPWNQREPSYGGKTLSSWLDEYGAGPGGYKPNPQADDALRHIGANAAPYLLQLLRATNDNAAAKTPASWKHWKAFLGFQALGPLGNAALPDLVKLAHNPDPAPDGYSNLDGMTDLALVAQMADTSSTYVSADDPRRLRRGKQLFTRPFLLDGDIAARSLAAIGADGVPPLIQLLADSNAGLRARAIASLGLAGAAAEPAVPALIKTLHDEPNVAVRVGAADALGCIARQPDLAIPALIEALADPTGSVSFYAANSLGKFRSRATNAIPALLLDFESPELNYNKRNSAAVALSKISPDFCAKKVIPVLIREVRESRGVLQVPGSQSANMSLIALGQMQDEDDLVIPVLIEVADDSNYHQIDRGNALRCLGGFGPFAQSAVPKLSGLTNDPDVEVRAEALRALQKIDPAPMPIR